MAAAAPSFDDIQAPTIRVWIGFLGMVVGMFMAILDIQIVASSIQQIQGGISATADEINWVQSSYLIAEVIVIPLSGWLARTFSTRYLFFTACLGFTVMSLACSFAWSIESMIAFRALQGFLGGALIPSVFAVVYTIFPRRLQPAMTILIGSVVTIAPTAGPVIGGYLTEVFSWHALFLINIIPGIVVCITTYLFVNVDEPDLTLLKEIDFLGIVLIALCLGTLQYTLEEGVREGWFESNKIVLATMVCFFSGLLMLYHELTTKNPIVDLWAFRNRNFAFGSIFSFVIGCGLYVMVYLQPLQLALVKGLNSFQIGLYVATTGLFQFFSGPIAAFLSKKMDLRLVLFLGLALFGLSGITNGYQTSESGYWEFFLPQMVRGLSLMLCFLPINSIALGTLPLSEVKNASGLYNLTRNLGGAIGLAVFNTQLVNWTKITYADYRTKITETSLAAQNSLTGLNEYLGSMGNIQDSNLASLKIINNLVMREATTVTFNQLYIAVGLLFFATLFIIPFVDKVMPGDAASKDAH